MNILGLLGGMSAESTVYYYQTFNRLVRERLGGLHSAKVILWSVDFAPMAQMQSVGDWEQAGAVLADAARRLELAGAQAILIGANTMHICAPAIAEAISVPLIHIADVTAAAIKTQGCSKPLLLATRYTMEMPFYRERLASYGLNPLVPDQADRDRLHAIIYDELIKGVFSVASKAEVLAMVGKAGDCDSVIFGCTEIGLLLSAGDLHLPVVDSALAHAQAGIDFALA